jgi:acyl-CoA thioester hydrolase
MTSPPFRIRVAVRTYELDTQGHLHSAVYHQYGEHARWECLRAAGVGVDRLLGSGVGPAQLACSIRFHHELRGGDEIDVSCAFSWANGKTFQIDQEYRRPDGTLVAELTTVAGLLDLSRRRLIPDPAGYIRALASAPEVLGLSSVGT